MVNLNLLVTGVGGQGVVLAGDILADVALAAGCDVKKTDTLGMAQRGGSVVTHLRMAEEVASPLIKEGEADILLAFEKLEAARWAGYLRQGASAIVNNYAIPPLSVSLGAEAYPDDDKIKHILGHRAGDVLFVEGTKRSAELGNLKVLNVFMLGLLSMLTPFSPEVWQEIIGRHLPAGILEINLTAFERGRHEMIALLSAMPGEAGHSVEEHSDGCDCH